MEKAPVGVPLDLHTLLLFGGTCGFAPLQTRTAMVQLKFGVMGGLRSLF